MLFADTFINLKLEKLNYLNSGDWIENMSAILIDEKGNIRLVK